MNHEATTHAVFWPRGERTASTLPLAPRAESLAGCRVAFLWDYVFRGDEIFPMLEAGLKARFPEMSFVPYEEFGPTHGDDEHALVAALPERLAALQVDAVVSGMGC